MKENLFMYVSTSLTFLFLSYFALTCRYAHHTNALTHMCVYPVVTLVEKNLLKCPCKERKRDDNVY